MGKFLDAALNGAASRAGKAYFFKDAKYVQYDWAKDQADPGYPQGLDKWGFPSPFDKGIDAAVEGREEYDKKAYFFKDDKYIRYDWTGKGKVDQAPKSILDGWKLPAQFFAAAKKIDAAINGVGEYARYCYLFSGTSWVRIDWKEQEDPVLHKGTAQADWGLPSEFAKGIDAALSGWGKKYGNKAYFFAADKYARFDWPSDKCDFKGGDLAAWKMSWDDASPTAQSYITDPDDVECRGWTQVGDVWLPTEPLYDKKTKLYARLTYAGALDACKRLGATLPERDNIQRLHDDAVAGLALELEPVELPDNTLLKGSPDDVKRLGIDKFRDANMGTLQWAKYHDDRVLEQKKSLKWDGKMRLANCGKHWIIGAGNDAARLMGWWEKPKKKFVQQGLIDRHNRAHHDYGTLTLVVRAKAP